MKRKNLLLDPLSVNVRWCGQRGMRWDDLRRQIQWIGLHRVPSMILVHLGGNDITSSTIQKMRRIIRRDFYYLSTNFPTTLLVWSDILPRLTWKFAKEGSDLQALDRKRLRFNMIGHQVLRELPNGRVLSHEITTDTPGLFANDGCHLSDVGTDLFCNSLQGGIETFFSSDMTTFGP